MEDELDYDTIRDLLSSDDDEQPTSGVIATTDSEISSEQADGRPVPIRGQRQADGDDSSDDDIDEDELDKLTALVEQQEQMSAVPPGRESTEALIPSTEPSTSKTTETTTSLTGPAKLKHPTPVDSTPEHEKVDELKYGSLDGKTMSEQGKAGKEIDYTDKLNELKIMQEKIKQLEAELHKKSEEADKKSSPRSPTNRPGVSKDGSSRPNNVVNCLKNQTDSKTKKQDVTSTKDIFGTALSRGTPDRKPKRKLSSPSPHSRTQNKQRSPRDQANVAKTSQHPTAHDSDSDWEGMDGEKPSSLSKGGREIKKILTDGPRERMAHTPKYEPSDKNAYNTTWKSKSVSRANTSSLLPINSEEEASNTPNTGRSKGSETNVLSDPFSGIRIINPLVPGYQMKSMMQGRRLIHISKLHTKTKMLDSDTDWVTIGVMVSKTESKKSAKGNHYSIWRLSDLDDCDKTVNFFLFSKVYQEHWKTAQGSVIGLLNPSIMQKEENKQNQDPSITIDNPKKMLLLGRSKDIGRCKSKTKAGNDCTNFVNITRGEYCTYHVQSAYRKHSAKRSELQAGYSGAVPKSFEKNLFNKGGTVMYGGQSYSTTGHSGTSVKKGRAVSLTSLQQHHVKTGGVNAKVSTLQIHDILPEDKHKLKPVKEDNNEKFHEALTIPSSGSMNYVKHLKSQDQVKEKEKQKSKPVTSISVQNFLKQSEKDMKARYGAHKRTVNASNAHTAQTGSRAKPALPSLGRGLAPGADVLFDLDDMPSPKIDRTAEQAKMKAVAKLKSRGGVHKEDPNASKKLKSPSQQERIKKRLAESSPEYPDENNEQGNQPPKKRSRVLGNIDLDDPDVKKLLNARSKHDGVLNQQEQDKMDQYFDPLEKKEAMEEKMKSVTEVKCKAYTCKQCKYTYYAPKKECREQQHNITCRDAIKKFFHCKKCKHRTTTLDKYPQQACKKCGAQNFERTSMLKEKNGPKLPGEDLLLRGEEIKYLNSLQS